MIAVHTIGGVGFGGIVDTEIGHCCFNIYFISGQKYRFSLNQVCGNYFRVQLRLRDSNWLEFPIDIGLNDLFKPQVDFMATSSGTHYLELIHCTDTTTGVYPVIFVSPLGVTIKNPAVQEVTFPDVGYDIDSPWEFHYLE